MNRLIILGNGFDLAHGLKTSYCDFVRWYLTIALNTFHEKRHYADELLVLEHKYSSSQYLSGLLPTTENQCIDVFEDLKTNKQYWNFEIKSGLLQITLHKTKNLKWVDIEAEYFDLLCKLEKNGQFDVDAVKIFNKQFDYLKQKLQEYLGNQEAAVETSIANEDILEILKSKFEWEDFDTGFESSLESREFRRELKSLDASLHFPRSTNILNFNYTNTFEKYVFPLKQHSNHKNIRINYIHGKLKATDNPIIFGFGDEYNKRYVEFEEQKNNDVFEHIKSYWYFKSSHYRQLVRYLNSDMFQVFILGHSCGLSDRTMFREIFEHDNCKSVKIYHYERSDGSNDFHEKTVELGRHFNNKGKMRKKIVEFDSNCKFPQPKND